MDMQSPTVAVVQLLRTSLHHETTRAGDKEGGEDDRGCVSFKRGSGRGCLQTPRPGSTRTCLSSPYDVSNRSHRVRTLHILIPPEIENHTSSPGTHRGTCTPFPKYTDPRPVAVGQARKDEHCSPIVEEEIGTSQLLERLHNS